MRIRNHRGTAVRRLRRKLVFAGVLGVCDGVLNSLTLASAAVLRGSGLTVALAVRVGVVALVSTWFTLFVAEYSQYRLDLVHAERQLMFTSSGRLAATHLGRVVIKESAAESTLAAVASFVGAAVPLMTGAWLPGAPWLALVFAISALGFLGAQLAGLVGGRRWVWVLVLIVAGCAVTAIGVKVDLV